MSDDAVERQLKVAISALKEIKNTVSNADPLWYPRRARLALDGIRMIDCELDVTPRMVKAASVALHQDMDITTNIPDDEIKRALCAALAAQEE